MKAQMRVLIPTVLSGIPGVLFFDGDSRLWQTSAAGNARTTSNKKSYKLYNVAAAGQAVSTMITNAPSAVDPYRASAHPLSIVWGGVNDILGTTPETVYTRLKTYCAARKAAGWKSLVCTEIDAQDAGRNGAGWHAGYLRLNALLRANWTTFADALIDLGADARWKDATDTTYYNADKVHPDKSYLLIGAVMGPIIEDVANGEIPAVVDYATTRIAGPLVINTDFTHAADCLFEFTVQTLQSAGTVPIDFRKQSSGNQWRVLMSADGSITLYEYVSSNPTQRGFTAGPMTNGCKVTVICQDELIQVFIDGVRKINYASAANYKAATVGKIASGGIAATAVYTNFNVWPLVTP